MTRRILLVVCLAWCAAAENATEHNATDPYEGVATEQYEGVLPSGDGAGFQWSFAVPADAAAADGVEGQVCLEVFNRGCTIGREGLGAGRRLSSVRPHLFVMAFVLDGDGREVAREAPDRALLQVTRKLRDAEAGEKFELRFSPAAARAAGASEGPSSATTTSHGSALRISESALAASSPGTRSAHDARKSPLSSAASASNCAHASRRAMEPARRISQPSNLLLRH